MAIGREIPESEDNIRTKYPALFNHPVHWETLMDINKKQGQDEADSKAKEILKISSVLSNRNKTAVRHRIGRRDYLRFQRNLENEMQSDIFDKMSNKISQMILNSADNTGTIPLHKSKSMMNRIKDLNTKGYKEMENRLKSGVRKSIRFGLLVSMDSAQEGL